MPGNYETEISDASPLAHTGEAEPADNSRPAATELKRRALARWENEGGAVPDFSALVTASTPDPG